MMVQVCEADDCERGVYARGLCGRHYKQMRRRGAAQAEQGPRPCAVEACGRRAVTRGWCHGHYLRWSRQGDVQVDVPLHGRSLTCAASRAATRSHSAGMCRCALTARNATATRCAAVRCARSRARGRSATATGGCPSRTPIAISCRRAVRPTSSTGW